MRHEKYRTNRKVPAMAWALVILALLGLVVGGVVAYLFMSGGSVKNTFTTETEVTPSILETFEENTSLVKKNVRVNVGNPG